MIKCYFSKIVSSRTRFSLETTFSFVIDSYYFASSGDIALLHFFLHVKMISRLSLILKIVQTEHTSRNYSSRGDILPMIKGPVR